MENFKDYIGVFTQAPLAVILLIFLYLMFKQLSGIIANNSKIIENNNRIIEGLLKIIKQIKRK